jgi:hypothetical protein
MESIGMYLISDPYHSIKHANITNMNLFGLQFFIFVEKTKPSFPYRTPLCVNFPAFHSNMKISVKSADFWHHYHRSTLWVCRD